MNTEAHKKGMLEMNRLFQNERCVICHEELSVNLGWVQLFSQESNTHLCKNCKKLLVEITGENCIICSRSFENGEYSYRRGDICFDCIRWEQDQEWQGILDKNVSLFKYNSFIKETLATFKYRGDYVIARAFADYMKLKLKGMKFDVLVPIPLSQERLYERGFNQAEALIKEAGFIPTPLLTRIHTEKQSKKSRSDRIHLPQVFRLNSELISPAYQNILLLDDIYTTGSTLRHAAKCLKSVPGIGTVHSLTLARG